GPYHLIVQTDVNNQVFEYTAENNNIGFDPDPMVITVPPPSDLEVSAIVLPASAFAGDVIKISWTGINHGPNPITGFWIDAVYISADTTWDIGDKAIGRVEQNRTLAVGATYTAQLNAAVPGVLPGGYHLIVRSDIYDTIPEGA